MTSRERVKRAIEFQGVDRIPVMHAILPAAWYRYGEKLQSIIEKYPSDLTEKRTPGGRPAAAGYEYSSALMRAWSISDDFAYFAPRTFQY